MKQIVTTGIVLARTDFQEADRILTILTPDQGKLRIIAKGVRKVKSKMAGGIELFSISQLTYIPGRGEINTLVSARLEQHYGNIAKDIHRTMLGYELLKRINKVTEDAAGREYFELLHHSLEGLDDDGLSNGLIEFWFSLQLLKSSGHTPNLRSDAEARPLDAHARYQFDHDAMRFRVSASGDYEANHIKLLRLGLAAANPSVLLQIQGLEELMPPVLSFSKAILKRSVRI